jgi:hypothetical protein
LQRSLALLKKHLSGKITLRELGFGPFDEIFIINPSEDKTISDRLILLMERDSSK